MKCCWYEEEEKEHCFLEPGNILAFALTSKVMSFAFKRELTLILRSSMLSMVEVAEELSSFLFLAPLCLRS